MLYNTILLWLLGLLRKLLNTNVVILAVQAAAKHTYEYSHSLPHPRPPTPTFFDAGTLAKPLLSPGAAVTLREPAIEVARIFAWLLRRAQSEGSNAKFSALFFLMTIGVAWSVLADGNGYKNVVEGGTAVWRELVRTSLKSSKITSGYATGENAFGFGFYAAAAGSESIPRPDEDGDEERADSEAGRSEDQTENYGRQRNKESGKGTTLWLSHSKLGSWKVYEEEARKLAIG